MQNASWCRHQAWRHLSRSSFADDLTPSVTAVAAVDWEETSDGLPLLPAVAAATLHISGGGFGTNASAIQVATIFLINKP